MAMKIQKSKYVLYNIKKKIKKNKLVNAIVKFLFPYYPNCNICQMSYEKFNDDFWHVNHICPNCNSYVRHRLFYAIFQFPNMLQNRIILNDKSVLHFAPEPMLKTKISKMCKEYFTADFLAAGYENDYAHIDFEVDISHMELIPSNSFDVIIANDVLEHVKEDSKAIKEIHRVLKKKGLCIITVPTRDGLEKTDENLENISPQERAIKFGQFDHWRIYGHDFTELLTSNGFFVEIIEASSFSDIYVKKHILKPFQKSNLINATNERRIYVGSKL